MLTLSNLGVISCRTLQSYSVLAVGPIYLVKKRAGIEYFWWQLITLYFQTLLWPHSWILGIPEIRSYLR